MKTNSLLTIVLLSLVLIFAGCSQAATTEYKDAIESQGEEAGEYVIGSILPLTGDAAAYGIPIQNIIEYTVEEINANGGVDGKNLKVVFEDGTCDGKGGASAIQKLISVDKVKFILGGLCSGETLGAAPIAEENQIILFSSASTSPEITSSGEFVFRNIPSDAAAGVIIAKQAVANGHMKMATISEITDYAQAYVEAFTEAYTAAGGEVVVAETFVSTSQDYRAQLTKIKSSDAQGLFYVPQTYATADLLLKQSQTLGIELQKYAPDAFAGTEVLIDAHGDYLEGTISATNVVDDQTELALRIVSELKEKYGNATVTTLPYPYVGGTYDLVYITADIMAKCGDQDSACAQEFLYSIDGREGAAGSLTIDSNGDAIVNFELSIVKDGKTVPIN